MNRLNLVQDNPFDVNNPNPNTHLKGGSNKEDSDELHRSYLQKPNIFKQAFNWLKAKLSGSLGLKQVVQVSKPSIAPKPVRVERDTGFASHNYNGGEQSEAVRKQLAAMGQGAESIRSPGAERGRAIWLDKARELAQEERAVPPTSVATSSQAVSEASSTPNPTPPSSPTRPVLERATSFDSLFQDFLKKED